MFFANFIVIIGIVLFNVLLAAAVLLPLAHVWARIGLPKAGCVSVCANCRYDLAGLPTSANCPECGHRARPPIRLYGQAPSWLVKAWLFGFIFANLPMYVIVVSESMIGSFVVVASATYSLVLLGCFQVIARRPNKTAVIVAMISTLGLHFLTQVFQLLPLLASPRRRSNDWYTMLPLQSIQVSAAGLAIISLIAILIIAITPDTDLTPPASP